MPSRRIYTLTLLLLSGILAFTFVSIFRNQPIGLRDPDFSRKESVAPLRPASPDSGTLQSGRAIAQKLGNETIKAELGRASWKLFHTMMAQFPDKPTDDESQALKSYIYLFQRLYPCGECANHFGELLKKFPPQVSSRSTAAVWACHVHNEVNKSLKKELFDCANIGEFYDCGCADDKKKDGEKGMTEKSDNETAAMSAEKIEKLATNGRDLNEDLLLQGLPAIKVG